MEEDDLFEGLHALQRRAVELAIEGRSFFLTGPGGTGKSEVIHRVSKYMDGHSKKYRIAATTGMAAVNIEGRTVHSLFRFLPHTEDLSLEEYSRYTSEQIAKTKLPQKATLGQKLDFSFKLLKDWRELEYLIVDEVSMLTPKTFQKMDIFLKQVRRNERPMGGLRMILVGDFQQLPPVHKVPTTTQFIFQVPLFYDLISEIVELTQCFRQENALFVEFLNRMRKGLLTDADVCLLQSCVGKDVSMLGIKPTILYSRNLDVDNINDQHLRALTGAPITYRLRKQIAQPMTTLKPINLEEPKFKQAIDSLVRDLSLKDVVLKMDAQVVLTFNLDVEGGLCNGSRGVIVGFTEAASHSDPETAFLRHPHRDNAQMIMPRERLPVVQFANGRKVTVPQTAQARPIHDDSLQHNSQITVQTIPLKLAWATTIHKSQGQTLDCVSIEMDRKIFEAGQAQVAASRVKSLEGLSLVSFDASVIKAHPKVLFFASQSLEFLKDQYKETNGCS